MYEKELVQLLKEKNYHISFAESITGGLCASTLINISGASDVIKESLIVYSNEAKIKYLNVNEKTIEKYNVVSKEVAEVIANAVPDEIIRYQWLLGEDEYKTEAAAIIARIKTKVDSIQYAQSGFELLLNHIGYERRFNAQTEETTLIKNGTGVVISPSAMRFLESEIVDFLEYRVHKLTGL